MVFFTSESSTQRFFNTWSSTRCHQDLISDVQTAFLPNRQILDGPFIINELLSWCKYKKHQAMVFKVDFAKAYDSIRWDFLEDVLIAFDFGPKWCSWISGCLNSGMASVLLNGSPSAEFQFYYGLKQGEWSSSNFFGITNILRCFSLLSGLSINLNKSNLLGVGVRPEVVKDVADSLGCLSMKAPFKYLGVMGPPFHVGLKVYLSGQISMAPADLVHSRLRDVYKIPYLDRWVLDLNGEGVFRVKDVRYILDDVFLPKVATASRWIKYVPIKVNILAWKVHLDRLPTRVNLQHRGVLISDSLCPICYSEDEDSAHMFFRCSLATNVSRLVCRWWDIVWEPLGSYSDWLHWFKSIRLSSKLKDLLEGVFYIS
uniref:RNA-directed DNA polymerase, eukaryota n=1 Tax=Tanacetum cinerariifolium TaxID=118510 RepID=A0A6L2MYN2_TANCI|nr:RNA-directed DNA polymerase, eukaryota [Tanacetum cinerariifolium]